MSAPTIVAPPLGAKPIVRAGAGRGRSGPALCRRSTRGVSHPHGTKALVGPGSGRREKPTSVGEARDTRNLSRAAPRLHRSKAHRVPHRLVLHERRDVL